MQTRLSVSVFFFHVILFNQRQQGEAAKMPLTTCRDRATEEPNNDVMQCLSKQEQDVSHEFTRFVIRGKRRQKVPELLTRCPNPSIFSLTKRFWTAISMFLQDRIQTPIFKLQTV